MSRILITGIGGPAGRASATFFHSRGHEVIGTDIQGTDTLCDCFHLVPPGNDPRFGRALLELISREAPSVLLPTVSEELPFVARLRREVNKHEVRLFISDPGVVDIANDKYYTAMRLRALGIPTPATLIPAQVQSTAEVASILGYPFIVKPRIGRGGRGVRIYYNCDEAMAETRRDVVFQEFISGVEYDVNLFAFPAGYTRAVVVLLKTAMKEGTVGNAVSVQRVGCPDVAEVAIAAARTLRLEGPVDMDIRRDMDGLPRILEINGRVGANVLAAAEVLEELSHATNERVMHHDALVHQYAQSI
ncbi:MAG: ATP-grasp domain-containing protein [Ignavibacteria bacterium]|nr:ATP-grasp domain-containing protein [Ignavibacteria bacterium]